MARSFDPWRRKRKERRKELAQLGRHVCRVRRVLHVRPEAIDVPAWAREHAVRGLTQSADAVWLQPKAAWLLAKLDRDAGGTPEVTEVEFRLCEMCKRPLLAEDAEARRDLTESAVTGHLKPCGPECLAAAKDGRWRRRR